MRHFLLTLVAICLSFGLAAQCNFEYEIIVNGAFCVPDEDGNNAYYIDFNVERSETFAGEYQFFMNTTAEGFNAFGESLTVGPVSPIGASTVFIAIVDQFNEDCTANLTINLADIACEPLECANSTFEIEVAQEVVCSGEQFSYFDTPGPEDLTPGFRFIERISTAPPGPGVPFTETIGGFASPAVYSQPGQWYYVQMIYGLFTQNGLQADFPCTYTSNVDSFFVAGTDFSHLQTAYDLSCTTGPLELSAVIDGSTPTVILWERDGVVFSTLNLVTIAETGSYRLQVQDAAGCTDVFEFIVSDDGLGNLPDELFVQGCEGDSFWCLEFSNFNWTIEWSNGATGPCVSDLIPGESYEVTITNEAGCTETLTFVADPPNFFFLDAQAVDDENCGNQNLVINLIENNPTFFYIVTATNIANGQSFTFTLDGQGPHVIPGLPPGDYIVDAFNEFQCFAEPVNVTIEANGLLFSAINVQGITCNGDADGSIDIEVQGTGPYTYLWSNGATTQDIDNLPAGAYTVIISSTVNDCQIQETFSLFEPESLEVDFVEFHNPDCGESNGFLEISVSGGTNPYSIDWSNGWDTPFNGNLAAGTYSVTVTDANGCSVEESYTLEDELNVEIEVIGDLTCETEEVTLFVIPNDGPFDYLWAGPNGFTSTSQTVTVNVAGEYSVTVTNTDGSGCGGEESVFIEDFSQVPIVSATSIPGDCGGGGVIIGEIANSFANEVILYLDGNVVATTFVQESFAFDGLEAGDYLIEVINDFGCSTFVNITVESNSALELVDAVVVNEDCAGNLGRIEVAVEGGSPPYEYEWSNGATGPEIFNLVGPETYIVTITDTQGCVLVNTFFVESENTFFETEFDVVWASCNGADGEITAFPNGGTAPYTYLWNNGATTATISNLAPGNYVVTITDANGCERVDDANVISGEIGIEFEALDPTCGASDGLIGAYPFGGQEPYTFLWSTGQTDQVIDGLPVGTYLVTVTDNAGCEAIGQITLESFLEVNIEIEGEIGCEAGGTVVLTAFPQGDNYSVVWTLNGEIISDDFQIIAEIGGVYAATVTDEVNGCTGFASRGIENSAGFTLLGIEQEPAQDCDGPTGLFPQFEGIDPFDESLTHAWTTPDGQVFEFPIPNLAVFESGTYVYTVTHLPTGCSFSASTVVLVDAGECFDLTGRLWADEGSCSLTGGEIPVPNWQVRIEDLAGNTITWALTNAQGFWSANVPVGTYNVVPNPYNEDLYYECDPPQSVEVVPGVTAYVDVFMPYLEACPTMYTNVVIPRLRRCFNNNIYVWYCNDGPVVAENAELLIELDPFLDFTGASITPSSINAHTVTFELGDLAPFECGMLTIMVDVSCDAEIGQTHCVEATASPNDPCPNPDNWNGANVDINATCDGTNMIFTITNNGTAPMTVPVQYIVIEDGIMMMDNPSINDPLGPGESLDPIILPANGSTYHFQTNQEPGNPGFPNPTLVVEGCGENENGGFTTGFVNMLPLGDNNTDWYDIACLENGGSFDPNNKVGFPAGISERHYIDEGTRLTYNINFQNTGTDTAFTVIIQDTLAEELDISTLRMGASSHNYTASLDSNRLLTITFNDIMLPDSNVNLLASQGVVQFTIDHTAGLPMETEIHNEAAIYFDFNEPIITNQTLHTIGKDFLPTSVRQIVRLDGNMDVFPNPTSGLVTVKLDLPGVGPYRLRLYDGLGRELKSKLQMSNIGEFEFGDLPAGWYLLRGEDEAGGARAAARILLQ